MSYSHEKNYSNDFEFELFSKPNCSLPIIDFTYIKKKSNNSMGERIQEQP